MKDRKDHRQRLRLGYSMQREHLGEWAAVLCILLFIVLASSWPKDYNGRSHPSILPEPSASYVKVVFPNGFRQAIPLHDARRIDTSDGSFSLLPRPTLLPLPPLPETVYTPPPPPDTPAWEAPRSGLGLFPIRTRNPSFPIATTAAQTNERYVHVSPVLREAGFTFQPPEATGAVRFTAILDLGLDGHVKTLLLQGEEGDQKALRPWRQALLAARSETNGYGRVDVETRPPTSR